MVHDRVKYASTFQYTFFKIILIKFCNTSMASLESKRIKIILPKYLLLIYFNVRILVSMKTLHEIIKGMGSITPKKPDFKSQNWTWTKWCTYHNDAILPWAVNWSSKPLARFVIYLTSWGIVVTWNWRKDWDERKLICGFRPGVPHQKFKCQTCLMFVKIWMKSISFLIEWGLIFKQDFPHRCFFGGRMSKIQAGVSLPFYQLFQEQFNLDLVWLSGNESFLIFKFILGSDIKQQSQTEVTWCSMTS